MWCRLFTWFGVFGQCKVYEAGLCNKENNLKLVFFYLLHLAVSKQQIIRNYPTAYKCM